MDSLAAFRVDLPLPDRILSPNAHVHWREKVDAIKGARAHACYWFRREKPKLWTHCPVVISVIYSYGGGDGGYRPRDVQNAIASLKPAIDGMVDAGVVPDDSHKWVQWGPVRLEKCIKGETSGVRITVTRVKDSP